VVDFDTEEDHTCAVIDDGTVWCWGWGSVGQLGPPSVMHQLTPRRVTGIWGATDVAVGSRMSCAPMGIAQVAMRAESSCFRGTDGSLRSSGWNLNGTVGDGTTTPRFSAVPPSW
jgi:alpha-tubulin suppressor-like RCC1 family protein